MARIRQPLTPAAAARAAPSAARRVESTLAWHVSDRAPALAAHARASSAVLARTIDDLRASVVAPSRRSPEPESGFLRLSGHGRSVCRALGEPRGEDGFLVLKGTEPTCEDYEAWVEEQAARSLRVVAGQVVGFAADGGVEARMPLLEKWAVLEGKVPCAVTLEEATSEAERAADFQRAYLAAHGETARVPLPIAVHRWPDAVTDRVRAALRARLSPGAMAIAESGLRGGLGFLAYAYPEAPVRLAHLRLPHAGEIGTAERLSRLDALLDWRAVARGWIDLAAEMLVLGFVAKSPAHVVRGDCLQHQNLVLDGGLADLDSVVRLEEIADDRTLADALRRTVLELSRGVATLLLGGPAQDPSVTARLPDVTASVAAELWSRLRRADAERRLPPRLLPFVRGDDWLDRVERALRETF